MENVRPTCHTVMAHLQALWQGMSSIFQRGHEGGRAAETTAGPRAVHVQPRRLPRPPPASLADLPQFNDLEATADSSVSLTRPLLSRICMVVVRVDTQNWLCERDSYGSVCSRDSRQR